jgi:murein DD-endopeptidase MepM/ murein hydrolase activator NlpD
MRNYTGEQVQQFGQQLTRAGMTAFSIGDAMQDQLDEAAAKESDIAYQQQVNEILQGPNGYLNKVGKDAETSYVSVNEQLIQAGQASMDRLNDSQKRLYQNVLARNMMTFQTQVQSHRDKQVKVYAGNEATARANLYVNRTVQSYKERDAVTTDGLPTGEYNTNLGVALNEIRTVGRLRGFAEDSAQMRELENAVYTQAAQGVVNRLMIDGQYQDGLDYVRKQLELNRIDPAKADAMIASLDANRKRQMVDELTTSIRTTGVLDTPAGTGNFDQIIENGRITVDAEMKRADGTTKGGGWLGEFRNKSGEVVTEYSVGVNIDGKDIEIPTLVPGMTKNEIDEVLTASESGATPSEAIIRKAVAHAEMMIAQGKSPFSTAAMGRDVGGKGIHIEAPPGAPVNAPANGTVTSVDGNTVTMETSDGTTLKFDNVYVFGLLAEGQTVTRGGMIGMVGKDDAAEDGLYRIGYTATRNGEAIDPRNLNSLDDSDRDEARRPLTLRDALTVAERIQDPEVRKQVQSNLRTQYAQEDALVREEYRNRLDAITEFLAVPGNTVGQIPPALWGGLKRSDQNQLTLEQRKSDEIGVMEELARDPSKLTVEYLDKHRYKMTPPTYLRLLKEAADPSKMIKASIEAETLQAILVRNGQRSLAFPRARDEDELTASLLFRDAVKQRIALEQGESKRELTRPELEKIVRDLLMDRAKTELDSTDVIAAMTPENAAAAYEEIVASIDKTELERIRSALQQKGQPLTKAKVASAYLERQRALKAKP